jgi:hypothetical protein
MTEVIRTYHKRFFISVIFDQLSTFVYEIKPTTGKESWGPQNKLMHFDDVLFALTYAYICRLSCSHMKTLKLDAQAAGFRVRYKLVRDSSFNLSRQPVKVRRIKNVSNA